MALKNLYNKQIYGKTLPFEEAFFEITNLSGIDNVKIELAVYDTEQKTYLIDNLVYFFSPSKEDGAKDWPTQAYEYLLTLPEFIGATIVS